MSCCLTKGELLFVCLGVRCCLGRGELLVVWLELSCCLTKGELLFVWLGVSCVCLCTSYFHLKSRYSSSSSSLACPVIWGRRYS